MKMPYYLGCPMWSNKDWVGNFLGRNAKPKDYLAQYASTLNSVEGNTTFYALPKREVVEKWNRATPKHFRFTFKFPRTISHDLALQETGEEVELFFKTLSPLHEKLGPLFLQLPPNFTHIDRLAKFLARLPHGFQYAVEVRNACFYDQGVMEHDLVELLTSFGVDQVIFDTHRLMALDTRDPELLDAKRRKPKMPPRFRATASNPFIRFVGHPDHEQDRAIMANWAAQVADWIREGRTPYIFMHQAPDDVSAPHMCRYFHELLQQHLPDLSPLPPFPCEGDEPIPQQLSLF